MGDVTSPGGGRFLLSPLIVSDAVSGTAVSTGFVSAGSLSCRGWTWRSGALSVIGGAIFSLLAVGREILGYSAAKGVRICMESKPVQMQQIIRNALLLKDKLLLSVMKSRRLKK